MVNITEEFDKYNFVDKIKIMKSAGEMQKRYNIGVCNLSRDGYLDKIEYGCPRFGDGDFSIYLWRHCCGDPFYVGLSKNDRWISLHSRNDEFYKRLDFADAIVYILGSGFDEKTGRLYEKYITLSLYSAGIDLANEANTQPDDKFLSDYEKDEIAVKLQNYLLDIILRRDGENKMKTTEEFLEKYGTHYFSDKLKHLGYKLVNKNKETKQCGLS
jgi:hypothetical protein